LQDACYRGSRAADNSYKGVPALFPRGSRVRFSIDWSPADKHRLYRLLSDLRRDGLLEANETKNGREWSLTDTGRKELLVSRSEVKRGYTKSPGGDVVVVSYDIPQKLRYERDWLRSVLHILGFQMVHRSVWIGKVLIPETF